jgi:hypothetical protein
VGDARRDEGKEALMRRARFLIVLSLLLAVSTSSSRAQDHDGQGSRDRFVGAWRLVWLEEPGGDRKVHRADAKGIFVFTREGRASVQVMYGRPRTHTPSGSAQYAQGGYEASFGTYDVDETARTFTYHIEGALVRTLVGKDLVRSFERSGRQMIVRSKDPKELWRVAWEHY